MNNKRFLNIIAVIYLVFFCSIAQYAQTNKYPALTESKLVFQGDKGKWDDNKVHTLSVVEANKDGYKYWGYYGLCHYGGDPAVRKCGLVRSNDLVNWEKFSGNPIVENDCRWPSVIYVKNTFYMFYAEYDAVNDSRIVMLTSKDGIHFDNKTEVVPREKGKQNQNPNIYYNEKDKCFYLSYYHGVERDDAVKELQSKTKKEVKKCWQIAIRKSKSLEGLKTAAQKILLSSDFTLAAPSLIHYNNKYYMIVEASKEGEWNDQWVTLSYESNKPDGKYKLTQKEPILPNNDACAFQHIFNNQLYIFYSHCLNLQEWNWELRMVKSVK